MPFIHSYHFPHRNVDILYFNISGISIKLCVLQIILPVVILNGHSALKLIRMSRILIRFSLMRDDQVIEFPI